MKLPLAWMRDFVDVPREAHTIAGRLASCGFEVASVDGDVIDFEITANRPDCLSVIGLAREAATAFDVPLSGRTSPPRETAAVLDVSVPITIDTAAIGARYAMVVADVVVEASPAWLADRLTAAGIRPINNVVDVTNSVMIELGQPMHAFDYARLAGPEIHVRAAVRGETLTTLDGQTRKLDAGMPVIADRDRAVAVAGVMGGATSDVSAMTSRIAIESAWFTPAPVRVASRVLGLKTEASARFERGANIGVTVAALERALALLDQLGALRARGPIVDVYPAPVAPIDIVLRRAHLDRLLGDVVPDADVVRILTALGFGVSGAAGGWTLAVPTWRVDVSREADLIEEVGRHWGFDRIPTRFPILRDAPREGDQSVADRRMISRICTGAGLQEAMTFTFIEHGAAAPFVRDAATLVAIANPLSEKFAVLRPSLLPALLDAVIYNAHRENPAARFFEAGAVFGPTADEPRASCERQEIGWVLTGAWQEHWSTPPRPVDFFDARGIADLVAEAFQLRGALRAEAANDEPGFVPGRTARLFCGTTPNDLIGVVGQIDPALVAARGLRGGHQIFAGVLSWTRLAASRATRLSADTSVARVDPLPRYPSIVRDLSFLVDARLPAASIRETIRANAPATLLSAREFDRYDGRGVSVGQISLSMRLTFRSADRTLTDFDVQQAVDAIVVALAREHGTTLRGAADRSPE